MFLGSRWEAPRGRLAFGRVLPSLALARASDAQPFARWLAEPRRRTLAVDRRS
jgi:hypothetical protein